MLLLGGILVFGGFLAALWTGAPGWIRLLVATLLLGAGIGLAVLAVYTPASTARQGGNRQLMGIERLLLAPLALAFPAGIVLVIVDRDLALGVRLLAVVVLSLPTVLFGVTVIATEHVPGRDTTSTQQIRRTPPPPDPG